MDNNMPHPLPGRIAVMGGGSWATALAKLIIRNEEQIGRASCRDRVFILV